MPNGHAWEETAEDQRTIRQQTAGMSDQLLVMEAKQALQRIRELHQSKVDVLLSYLMTCLREVGIRPHTMTLSDRIRDALEEAID